MTATQGVILIMIGVLILYLIWAKSSPLNVTPAPSGNGG